MVVISSERFETGSGNFLGIYGINRLRLLRLSINMALHNHGKGGEHFPISYGSTISEEIARFEELCDFWCPIHPAQGEEVQQKQNEAYQKLEYLRGEKKISGWTREELRKKYPSLGNAQQG